jgi:pimeloyl-ACP methyl ester carboxylesterase
MATVRSRDGTAIAFDKQGDGPALILVDGALGTRSSGSKPELAKLLAQHLTVYSYDRRGRGDSGDTTPYAVEREVEDIDALIDEAGGSAFVHGHSSGACLALHATVQLGDRVKRLALYEAPWNDDPAVQQAWGEYLSKLAEALASDRRGDAVALFMAYVGTPTAQIEAMRHSRWTGRSCRRAHPGAEWWQRRAVHARNGQDAQQDDSSRHAADAGRSDSRRSPGRARTGPCGILRRGTRGPYPSGCSGVRVVSTSTRQTAAEHVRLARRGRGCAMAPA